MLLHCTMQGLNRRLWQVSRSLTGSLVVTFGGVPNFDVANSLDGAYLGSFTMVAINEFLVRLPSKRADNRYRSGTVNSKSFVGKVLLRIKWKFELINAL